ncbi:B-cell receptor CD22-like isoform X2 [Epinephelus lanceolatus]
MSSTAAAAASGFVVFLLSVQVIQGQNGWAVTYTSTEICAVKGSTVNIGCSYTYPPTTGAQYNRLKDRIWFTKMNGNVPVDLRKISNRVQYSYYINNCTLTIRDLRESDSAVYKFRFTTNQLPGYTGLTGVTLSVTEPDLQVQVRSTWPKLKCHSRCVLPARHSYVWFRNERKIWKETSYSYSSDIDPADSYSCAIKQHERWRSPPVYAPKLPSVSVSPSAEIVEGSSVTLTCSSDANPAATYTWYKNNGNLYHHPQRQESQLVFSSIQSSDSGEYDCTAENELGWRTSNYISINVKYAPKLPSVSVSPSAEIVEGSSVTLTCSSDANPAATYTWYKKNQTLHHGEKDIYHFTSISSEDRGTYFCKSQNQHGQINSSSLFLDVQYAPKLPSVSVRPSAEMMEGSSVNLTCSSDAKPAAKYTWYKEDEDSPKALGPIFAITDIRAEQSGNYYCEAENKRGRHNSTLQLIIVSRSMKSVAAGSITAIFLAIIFVLAFLFIRRKRSWKQTPEPRQRPDDNAQANMGAVYDIPPAPRQTTPSEQQDDLCYASVSFSKNQEDPLYSNVRLNQPNRHREEEEDEDDVEYSVVNFKSAGAATESIQEEPAEDSSVLYSTVLKKPRV